MKYYNSLIQYYIKQELRNIEHPLHGKHQIRQARARLARLRDLQAGIGFIILASRGCLSTSQLAG